jgi:hypothetical protein
MYFELRTSTSCYPEFRIQICMNLIALIHFWESIKLSWFIRKIMISNNINKINIILVIAL